MKTTTKITTRKHIETTPVMKVHEILLLRCYSEVISVHSDPSPIVTKYLSFQYVSSVCMFSVMFNKRMKIKTLRFQWITSFLDLLWKLFTYLSGFAVGRLNPEQKL